MCNIFLLKDAPQDLHYSNLCYCYLYHWFYEAHLPFGWLLWQLVYIHPFNSLTTVIPVWDLVYRLLKSKTAEFTFYYLCVQHKGLLRAEVHCHNFGAISMQVTNLRRKAQLWATGKPFKAQHLGAAWVCHGESFLIIAAHVTVSKIQKVRQIWEKHSEGIITIITNSGYRKLKYPSNKWYNFYSIMLLNVWIIQIF